MENTEQQSIEATNAFNLTDRLTIFSYLVSSNRVRWYRVIMRTFWHNHRELYRYQLTAQEVRDALREQLDPDYSLEQCQNDLVALKEWGCLTTIYDSSRATSIASFLGRPLYPTALVRVRLRDMEAALLQSNFQCSLADLLQAVFAEQPLITRPQQRQARLHSQEQFLQRLQALRDAQASATRGSRWLQQGLHGLEWLFSH